MADTLDNINLPANTWVDLYAAAGINPGTQLGVQNLGAVGIRLATSPTQPTGDGFQRLASDKYTTNKAGSSGAWAFSPVIDGVVNVGVA